MSSEFVYEVLEKAAKASTKEEKIEILKENNSISLRNILKGSMDESVIFLLPEGTPPYVPDDAPHGYTKSTLNQKTDVLSYFVKGGKGEGLMQIKRERMFIELLESIHAEEAKLVILMKDKALINKDGTPYYSGITKELVKEVFPGLIKV